MGLWALRSLHPVSQTGNRRRDRPFAQVAKINFGDILQLEDNLGVGVEQQPARYSFAVLLVFGDFPGVKIEDVARAKGRAAIGVKRPAFDS